jgi:hypothetical protein
VGINLNWRNKMTTKIVKDIKTVYDQAAVTMIETIYGTMFNTQNFKELLAFIETENSGGTNPTLDITIETYDPVQANWFTIVTFTQIITDVTAMENNAIATYGFLIPLGQWCRMVYTIGGTSPTFDVTCTLILKS